MIYSSNGEYTFSDYIAYPLHLSGGELEDTHTLFNINMSAQSGTVISPITTFFENHSTLLAKPINLIKKIILE